MLCQSHHPSNYLAVGQSQWYHFGVGALPILIYFRLGLGCSLGVRAFDPWPLALAERLHSPPPRIPGARGHGLVAGMSGRRLGGGTSPGPEGGGGAARVLKFLRETSSAIFKPGSSFVKHLQMDLCLPGSLDFLGGGGSGFSRVCCFKNGRGPAVQAWTFSRGQSSSIKFGPLCFEGFTSGGSQTI